MIKQNDKVVTQNKFQERAIDAFENVHQLIFGPIMFQAASAMLAFGVLAEIKRKPGISFSELQQQTKLSAYGLKILLEAGEVIGLIFQQDHQYKVTKAGVLLLHNKMVKANFDFVNEVCYTPMRHLTQSIEDGHPEGLKDFGEWDTIYQGLSKLPEKAKDAWFQFDHHFSDQAFPEALKLLFEAHKINHLVDIGGNTGKWAKACCTFDEQVQVHLFDLPTQLQVAQQEIEATSFAHRVHYNPINILHDELTIDVVPDIIWMSQFLDCFSEEEIVMILQKVRKISSPQTTIYISELFWDQQQFQAAKLSLVATTFYFTCLANGNSKMYASNDFKQLLARAGLRIIKEFPLVGGSYHTLLRCEID